jgi:triphosphatase
MSVSLLDRTPGAARIDSRTSSRHHAASQSMAAPVRLRRPHLEADATLPEAVRILLRHALEHALANVPAILGNGSPAAIHQMRVGLRRLRSAVSAFEPALDLTEAEDLIDGVKMLFALLGEVRDADVFLTETLPAIPASVLTKRRRASLERTVAAYRAYALMDLQSHLESADFAHVSAHLHGWIEDGDWLADPQSSDVPVRDFALDRLQHMRRKFAKLGKRALTGSLDDWHRVRIMAKKLRYASESLMPAIGDKLDSGYAKRLARLQDSLGHINDAHSVRALLGQARAVVLARSRPSYAEAMRACTGWGQATAKAASRKIADDWSAFEAG